MRSKAKAIGDIAFGCNSLARTRNGNLADSMPFYQIIHSGSWGLKPMLKAALVGAAAFAILTSVNFLPKAH